MEKGSEGGEKAAGQPVSDYIIALQDLKLGLRRNKNASEQLQAQIQPQRAQIHISDLLNHCSNNTVQQHHIQNHSKSEPGEYHPITERRHKTHRKVQ